MNRWKRTPILLFCTAHLRRIHEKIIAKSESNRDVPV